MTYTPREAVARTGFTLDEQGRIRDKIQWYRGQLAVDLERAPASSVG